MPHLAAWLTFALGLAHLVFGLVKYKKPLAEAVSAGYIGQFAAPAPEARRTAFWFVIFGPLLMAAGHVAIHAVAVGDLALLQILGIYVLVTALAGIAAFPKSPFWAALLLGPWLIATGYGLGY